MINKIVVIGIGGIGSHLLPPLLQYLRGKEFYRDIIFVDGDHYEEKNKERQIVTGVGENKADSTAKYYMDSLKMNISSSPRYVTQENIRFLIGNDDVIFLCVDNNKTRKLIDDYISNLDSVCLISGGNELLDGNAQIVMRSSGEYVTKRMSDVHPEMMNPTDKSPDEMSCEELQHSQPQIGIVNAGISDVMRRMFFGLINKGINYYETYVNFNNGNIRNVQLENGNTLKIQI
jgi:molybdopterin/thiamine biosynthesis adenylyltransferase